MKAFGAGIAAVVVLLFVVTQFFVPPFLEGRVGAGLAALAEGGAVDVQLSSFPAFRLLTGAVGRLEARMQDVVVDGLHIADFHLQARNVDVDVGRLLRGDGLPVRGAERFAVEVVVTEDALGDYVNGVLSFPGRVATALSPDGLRLTGDVQVLNNVLPVVVEGRFHPTGGAELLFVPEDVAVQGQGLPAFLLAVLRESYTMRVDLKDGPFPFLVDEVVHEAGRLVLRGRPDMAWGPAAGPMKPAPSEAVAAGSAL